MPPVRHLHELFGCPVHVLDGTYALLGDEDGRTDRRGRAGGPGQPYTGLVAYFPVDDVDAVLAGAERLGATESSPRPTRPPAASPSSPISTATTSASSAADRPLPARAPHRSITPMTTSATGTCH